MKTTKHEYYKVVWKKTSKSSLLKIKAKESLST